MSSHNRKGGQAMKFEDSYLGYSDEEEDAFNDATFGGDIPLGQDFNFGGPSSAQVQPTVKYADAAREKPQQLNDDSLMPMQSLWGGQQQQQPQQQPQSAEPLSLDQLESQLTSKDNAASAASAPNAPGQIPPQFPGFPPQPMFYPPGFIPQQQVPLPTGPPGFNQFPPQIQLNQISPQQFAQLPPEVQQNLIRQAQAQAQAQFQQFPGQFQQPPQQASLPQPQQPQQQPLQPQQEQQQQPIQPSEGIQQEASASAPSQEDHSVRADEIPQQRHSIQQDLSQFPVLGSDEANILRAHPQQYQQQQQQQQQQHQHHQNHRSGHQSHHNQRNNNHRYGSQHHDNFKDLPEEEQQRLIKRQHKVQRILQFSGIMTPRDKDFVSRIQLSHIVTDDPYNEDFYFQVFRVIKTGDHNVNNSSIAQAYLNFSGHKLGGRHQRADLALQRMQQQVQKAVTVAKERPRTTQFTREGALGKVSLISGKRPRKQLEILIDKKPELPEITKVGKKSSLLLIEEIYQQILLLESAERENKPLDLSDLWESLKLYDNSQSLNQFIQTLSYEKGLKIFPRIFHFLNRQQKLTIVTLIFANLSLIKIINKSSFKNHENDEIPSDIQKTIDLFQLCVSKPIIVFLSYEAALSEIIGLLTILVEHNNISFLSTSKLGVSLITILLSRAEIIKQEQSVSSEDSQHWNNAYESLFSSLETKLPLIFPSSKLQDDSYIWQFLASLSLSGKINHQRIIVDEIRDEIFGSISKAKEANIEEKAKIINNLNLFLNVIGLSATEDEIVEIK